MAQILHENGANVATYLTRNYGHYSPALVGPIYTRDAHPNPCPVLQERKADLVVPMSIDWAQAPWANEFLDSGIPILSPVREAMRIERERNFARDLCLKYNIPFPKAFVAPNRLEAEKIVNSNPCGYVLKNPLCSPTSPVHTVLCETVEDTHAWLRQIDYAEGVFLQEYLGRREAGHIAFISNGEIHPVVTNQEYKRAFAGDMGVVAGAPLGGLVEKDPEDKYGLCKQLIRPLLSWFREVNYHGPIQVTAVQRDGVWNVIEYNIRVGVTSGPMILRMLRQPVETLLKIGQNKPVTIEFNNDKNFGCELTLAGYGYPFVHTRGPRMPINVSGTFDCDVWWNEATSDGHNGLMTTGQRIVDVIALGSTLQQAIDKAYENIRRIRSLGSYFRPDIGMSLWPPGQP